MTTAKYAEVETEYGAMRFTDADVVLEGYNADPRYCEKCYLIYNELGTLAVVFARHKQDALDLACDSNKLKSQLVSVEDYAAMPEEEQEECIYLGNASEPHYQTYLGIVELVVPAFSLVRLFGEREGF